MYLLYFTPSNLGRKRLGLFTFYITPHIPKARVTSFYSFENKAHSHILFEICQIDLEKMKIIKFYDSNIEVIKIEVIKIEDIKIEVIKIDFIKIEVIKI